MPWDSRAWYNAFKAPQNNKPRKKMSHEEDDLQATCFEWFSRQYPKLWLFAIPNGAAFVSKMDDRGRRYSPAAIRMKKMGLRPGVSDFMLALPRFQYHGFFIEMKTPDGTVSKEQKAFLADMGHAGYKTAVVRDFERFVSTVKNYIFGTVEELP